MGNIRRHYTKELKQEAVALTYQPGSTIAQVARDLGIDRSMLGRWHRQLAGEGEKAFPGKGNLRDEEIARLKKELQQARMERDILKTPSVHPRRAGKEIPVYCRLPAPVSDNGHV